MKPVFGGFDTRLKFIEFRHKNLTGSPGKPHFNGFPEAEFKEFEPRLKFKRQLKYGWFNLKLYYIFQDFSRCSIETGFWGI